MRFSWMILLGLSAGGLVVPGAAHAVPTAVDMATISMTALGLPRTVTDTVCATDGNDLVCDRGVYITPAGQVGIGFSSPSALFSMGNSTVAQKFLLWESGSVRYGFGIQSNEMRTFVPNHATVGHTWGTVSSTDQSYSERMRLTSSGYLGIGTSSPLTPMDVAGSIRTTGYLVANSGGAEGGQLVLGYAGVPNISGQSAAGTWNLDVYSDNALRLFRSSPSGTLTVLTVSETSGYVGILDGTPTAALDLGGTLKIANGGEACDAIRLGAIRYFGGDFSFCRNGSAWESLTSLGGGGSTPAGPNRAIQFNNNGILGGLSAAQVDASGNIITSGTNIYAGGNYGYGYSALQHSGNATNSGYVGFFAPESLRAGFIGYADTSWIYLNAENGRNWRMNAAGGIISTDGNLAIGKTTAASALDVSGTIRSTGSGFAGLIMANPLSSRVYSIYGNATGYLTIGDETSSTARIQINPTGFVGIGMPNPLMALDVAGAIRGQGLSGAGDVLVIGNDSKLVDINVGNMAGLQGVQNAAVGGLTLGTGGGYVWGASNSVGINTQVPAARLDVNGEVRVGSTSLACSASTAGAIQYSGGTLQYCNGTSYVALAGTGALGSYVAKAGDTMSGNLAINNSGPTLTMQDTDQRSGFLHVNSNFMYFLGGGVNAAGGAWAQNGSYWPLTLNLQTDEAVFGGDVRIPEGNLTISNNGGSSIVYMNRTNGGYAYTRLAAANSARWDYGVDNANESGSNAGSNFYINRFSDAGAYLNTPLIIYRYSGDINLNGNTYINGQTAWHGGNDGASSGLDADLLDGLHASSFVQVGAETDPQVGNTNAGNACIGTGSAVDCGDSNVGTKDDITTRTASGFWQTSTATTGEGWPSGIASWAHLLTSTHSNTGNYYSMQFAGDFYDATKLFYRVTNGSGAAAWHKLWHSGNDGSGSGLDADTLDGVDSSQLATTGQLGSYVAKAGDTMSGALTAPEIRVGTGADYAGMEIRSYQTGFPYLDFSLNNSEDFRVRQYVDRGTGAMRFQGADSNINLTIAQNGALTGRGNLTLGSAIYQNDGNIYMPWLGGWLSSYFNQDVRNGANPTFGTVYTNNWFRSSGSTGWFNETYGGGWHMSDSTWLRAYNNKSVYTPANIRADGQLQTNNLCDTSGANCTTPASIASAAAAAANKVSKAGDTMSGNLTVNANLNVSAIGYFDRLQALSNVAGGNVLDARAVNGGGTAFLGYNSAWGYYCYIAHYDGYAIICSGPTSGVSDGRLKTDITPLKPAEGLDAIMALKPVHYRWKESSDKRSEFGFIAQDVEKVLPGLVGEVEQNNATTKLWLPGKKQKVLNYERIIAPTVLAIQQLKAENDRLRAANDNLNRTMQQLQADVEALKASMAPLHHNQDTGHLQIRKSR